MPPTEPTISVFVRNRRVDVAPETSLLRCLAELVGRNVSEGNYCWTGECGHCEVAYGLEGAPERVAMACVVIAKDGMCVTPRSRHLAVDLRA